MVKKISEDKDELSTQREIFWMNWKRRGFLILALLLLLVPLFLTFQPLFEFILFAISLAVLTYPIFFRPISTLLSKIFQGMKPSRLSEISAVLATLSLLLVLMSPLLLVLFDASDKAGGILEITWSIALGEDEGREAIMEIVGRRIRDIQSI